MGFLLLMYLLIHVLLLLLLLLFSFVLFVPLHTAAVHSYFAYFIIIFNVVLNLSLVLYLYIPLTNRVRGPYRKLRTEYFLFRFIAKARRARAINRKGKNEDP